ncbi:MAG: ferrochelatase [Myxococcota bacterium]
MMSTQGILLVNLGSPASTEVEDVRTYLGEFLMDDRVLDVPYPVRWALVNLVILPTRPRESAEAYSEIWTPEGSPLIVTSQHLQDKLRERLTDIPIALGMRYAQPSIESAVKELARKGVDQIFLIPLYPHYAMSSYETVVVKTKEVLAEMSSSITLEIQPPFFEDPDYINALVDVARPWLDKPFDHLLMSYHGIPERHITKRDPSGAYCLQQPGCCDRQNPAHGFCYRAQVFRTSRAFAARAEIPADKYSVSFQSRLGRDPWLRPYTDQVLASLPARGVKKLLVMCPAFVSDCLETLEEIDMRGREDFLEAGGEEFAMIPCLNEHPSWIGVLERFIKDYLAEQQQAA